MHTQLTPTPSTSIRARVIRVGNSVGVRLPASLHLELGAEVEVTVRPVNTWPEGFFDMEAISADFTLPERESANVSDARYKRLFGAKAGL